MSRPLWSQLPQSHQRVRGWQPTAWTPRSRSPRTQGTDALALEVSPAPAQSDPRSIYPVSFLSSISSLLAPIKLTLFLLSLSRAFQSYGNFSSGVGVHYTHSVVTEPTHQATAPNPIIGQRLLPHTRARRRTYRILRPPTRAPPPPPPPPHCSQQSIHRVDMQSSHSSTTSHQARQPTTPWRTCPKRPLHKRCPFPQASFPVWSLRTSLLPRWLYLSPVRFFAR